MLGEAGARAKHLGQVLSLQFPPAQYSHLVEPLWMIPNDREGVCGWDWSLRKSWIFWGWVLGFEFRALKLLGRYSTTEATMPALFSVVIF